jgi:hypothetical protein
MLHLLMAAPGPKAKSAHVRLHVGYWVDERNCYKWDQSVTVDPFQSSATCARCDAAFPELPHAISIGT